MLSFMFLLLVGIVSSQMAPMCASTTASQCTVTFTAEGTSQVGPTSTVWGAIMTTYLNVVDCRYCKIENVPFNPSQLGPFTTKITSSMMTVTEVGCMPETTAITRRGFRGYEEVATVVASTTAQPHLPHAKRQNATSLIPISGLPLQAQVYMVQLNTVLFSIDLVNVGSDLNGTCQDLRGGANNTETTSIAINITQAADFVCAAYAANLTYIDPSIVQIFGAALYAVEVAANFTGTTNATDLCNSIDMNILTISMFGIDGYGLQSYVCNANNATLTTLSTVTSPTTIASVGINTPVGWSNQTFSATGAFTTTIPSAGTITPISGEAQNFSGTDTSPTIIASVGTITPIGWGNVSSFGTAPIATGPVATGASTHTGDSGLPFGNYSGTRTRSYTGPRTRSSSGYWQPASTGLPQGNLSVSIAQSGSGYDQPTSTDDTGSPWGSDSASSTESGSGYDQPTSTGVSDGPYGSLTAFPTGSSLGYVQPTGTGVSGWPYGNITDFPTGSGSSYAQPTATVGSDDPFGIQFSSLEQPYSARLPPNPSTVHYYPAVSSSASPIVFYGYGYQG